MFTHLPVPAILLLATMTSGSPLRPLHTFSRRATDVYQMYTGDGSTSEGWPAQSQWESFDSMFEANKGNMLISCAQFSAPNDSEDEVQDIYNGITTVSGETGVDPRFILAIIMQESTGCVRAPTTIWSVRNPGLMQDHNGTASCNDGVTSTTPCPADTITQMIRDGVAGTQWGDGLVQCLEETGASDVQKFYMAARIYNSGSIAAGGDLGSGGSTHCYSSDIANRLTGWVHADHACCLNTGCSPDATTYASTPSTGWWSTPTSSIDTSVATTALTPTTTLGVIPLSSSSSSLLGVSTTSSPLGISPPVVATSTSTSTFFLTLPSTSSSSDSSAWQSTSSSTDLLTLDTTSSLPVVATSTSTSTVFLTLSTPSDSSSTSLLVPETTTSSPSLDEPVVATSTSTSTFFLTLAPSSSSSSVIATPLGGLFAEKAVNTSATTSPSSNLTTVTLTWTGLSTVTVTNSSTWWGTGSIGMPTGYLTASTTSETPSSSTALSPVYANSSSRYPTASGTARPTRYATWQPSSYPTAGCSAATGTAACWAPAPTASTTKPWVWPVLTPVPTSCTESKDSWQVSSVPSPKGIGGSWGGVIGSWW